MPQEVCSTRAEKEENGENRASSVKAVDVASQR